MQNFAFVLRLAYALRSVDLIHYANEVGGMIAFQRQGDAFMRGWERRYFTSAFEVSAACLVSVSRGSSPQTSNCSYTFKLFVCAPMYQWRAALNSNFTTICDGGWTDQYFIPL